MIYNPFVIYPEISKLSEEKIYRMILSEGNRFRHYLAGNINTPAKILDFLSTDEDYCIRWRVAENPNTPPESLDRLSSDEYWIVYSGVAENPNTPQYIKDLFKFKDYLRYYADP